jgi:MFS transporter, DHA2 family, multidrug resistance protein
LQGVGGAFLAPLAQSIMLDINKPSEQPRAMSIYGMGIMIGPILGPIAGGWLTEAMNWRWCFFVNFPVGGLCLLGLALLLPEKPLKRRQFDLLGFLLLACGLAALQLMLDRGQHQDWFASTEIWIEAALALAFLWMFAIHLITSRNKPLFPPEMLADRNFLTCGLFMFIIGMVMLAAMALLPALMQGIYGYPVLDTGWILASRGLGVMITMAMAGKLMSIIDPRLQVAGGFSLTALSLWWMTHWSIDMPWQPLVATGLVQGMGIGFVFVPLQVLAFGTLAPAYRTEGAALLNLTRNLGSSVGIAIVMALLSQNGQVAHADLASNVRLSDLNVDLSQFASFSGLGTAALIMLDGMISREAAMIAFLDDFLLLMCACLVAVPSAFLLRLPKKRPAPGQSSPAISE